MANRGNAASSIGTVWRLTTCSLGRKAEFISTTLAHVRQQSRLHDCSLDAIDPYPPLMSFSRLRHPLCAPQTTVGRITRRPIPKIQCTV
ncbi:uncharacterized protein RCC_00229 [Ramularia collo-cygni]|uniref:Uncharacterized protein n=1 Tax=Ramularia collo-cygni TaxID=112498 RepID=A0A2D3UW38_9PEZI|nr:uncharacterized protein RCC_00229 [Ramularia collo-cygni]CZT14254.1 uncharacterized protein RCC_00229 [Ramularia collo-cygni]